MAKTAAITVPAIKYNQGTHTLYSFVIEGKQINEIATVKLLGRDVDDNVVGFQRPEIKDHIKNIKGYLESPNPMIPNSIVLAFMKKQAPKFTPFEKGGALGTLTIQPMSGFKVDGQQRTAAIREADVNGFLMNVVAFVSETEAEMTSHFFRVNNQKNLSKSIQMELLPHIEGELPLRLEQQKLPRVLLDRLNNDPASPLKDAINTATNDSGIISEGAMMAAIHGSLKKGVLFYLRDDETDERMLGMLYAFWGAVEKTWPLEVTMPKNACRIYHAAGVQALSDLMDEIAEGANGVPDFLDVLTKIHPYCHWTEGEWDFGHEGKRAWNKLENTKVGVELLKNYFHRLYVKIRKEEEGSK